MKQTKLEKMVSPKKVRKMYRQAINEQMDAEFTKRTNALLFRVQFLTVACGVLFVASVVLSLIVSGVL